MKKNKCFWSHNFSKWQEISRQPIKEFSGRNPALGWYEIGVSIVQERICEDCGFKEINRQEVKCN